MPPAGHDPQLFQIEDVEPRTRSPCRRASSAVEPYAPIGFRIGRFVRLPAAGAGRRRLFQRPAQPDRARAPTPPSRCGPSCALVSNWRWHALELKANGVLSYHEELPSEDDRRALLEARGRLESRGTPTCRRWSRAR